MSYFCLVPENAVWQEHLTLVWCGKDVTWNGNALARLASIESFPVEGFVYGHARYGDKPVALVALPHRIHLMRHGLFSHLDVGDWPEWSPHITHYNDDYPLYELGEGIIFTHVEWRP